MAASTRDTSFFEETKRRVPLEDYLAKHLGVDLVPDGPGRLAAICPFHEEDTPSFKISETDEGWKRWYCFGACREGGSVIDAVMKAENLGHGMEAVEWLNEHYNLGLETNTEAYARFRKTVEETRGEIEQARAVLDDEGSRHAKAAREYLQRRGFDEATIEHYGLGVDTKLARSGRLSIPLVDKANHPISMDSRALFDSFPCRSCREPVSAKMVAAAAYQAARAKERNEAASGWDACPHCGATGKEAGIAFLRQQYPKYRFSKDFDKSRFLYHQYEARRALARERGLLGLFLVEGYADCWAGWQSGQHAICAYNGAVLSEWQARQAVELALRAAVPIVLVPDMDETGRIQVEHNIAKLREAYALSERALRALPVPLEIQVLHDLDRFAYKGPDGAEHSCKDLGELLQHFGAETVAKTLRENRRPSEEWLIRQVIEARNPVTGGSFHSKQRQMQLVAGILADVRHRQALDHLIPVLADAWSIRIEEARGWFYSNLSSDTAASHQHLIKDIDQAQEEARLFLSEKNVIPFGYDEIDRALPGNGARKGWLAMLLGKSGTGKTMLASQVLANMAEHGVRAIFFSLEQKAGQLYERIACQVLDKTTPEVEELIASNSPELQRVNALYRNLYIVDNVPTETEDAVEMTPKRIEAIIREVNMTHFERRPADVVMIDHLGILVPPEDAPSSVRRDEMQAPGFIMQELFKVCKAVNVMMLVLQQLPKEVSPGKPFSYDAGRGGSKQTDYCDLIFCVWRPEQAADIDDTERSAVKGQYKLQLGKNRYGPQSLAHLFFDSSSLRIIPALRIVMPTDDVSDTPRVDVPGVASPTAGDVVEPPSEEDLRRGELPRDMKRIADELGFSFEQDDGADGDFDFDYFTS